MACENLSFRNEDRANNHPLLSTLAVYTVYIFRFGRCDLKVSMELFDSWFHTTTLEIGEVHDKLIDDYMVCWMQERKFTDKNGEIDYDALYEWVRKDVYRYFGKDITTHPLEERKEIAAKIIPECQTEVGFGQFINGKEIGAYNCIASKIGKI